MSADVLTWREASTGDSTQFVGYDADWDVARVSLDVGGTGEWRWSVHAIIPPRPWITHGFAPDLRQAQAHAEAAWAYAKANGRPTADRILVENWTAGTPGT